MERILIRRAKQADSDQAADLIVRTKRLNNEFDPIFTVSQGAQEKARRYFLASLKAPKVLLIVGAQGPKVIAVIRAEIRERILYEPDTEGFVTDFYILPEFRRKALGAQMIERASAELKRMGAKVITAGVPSRNEIAVRFYTKRGFRPVIQLFTSED